MSTENPPDDDSRRWFHLSIDMYLTSAQVEAMTSEHGASLITAITDIAGDVVWRNVVLRDVHREQGEADRG